MAEGNVAWEAIRAAHEDGSLSDMHEQIYFRNPRPVFELYDLENDPYELNNLAGQASVSAIETELRKKLDRWMIRESDYLAVANSCIRSHGLEAEFNELPMQDEAVLIPSIKEGMKFG